MAGPMATAAGIASLQVRARVVRLALVAFLLVAGSGFAIDLVILARQLQLADPPLAINALASLAALAFVLVILLAAIPILLWVHRAHANLHDGGMAGLAYAPGWAMGSYFVPFVNLVVPFKAMRELYNRSLGEPADFAQSSAGPVTSWWACHVPAVLLLAVLTALGLLPLLSNVWVTAPPAATTTMGLFNQLLWMGSAWFLHQTVTEITWAQSHGVGTAEVFA